jgi:hypothetical protein
MVGEIGMPWYLQDVCTIDPIMTASSTLRWRARMLESGGMVMLGEG